MITISPETAEVLDQAGRKKGRLVDEWRKSWEEDERLARLDQID